MAQLNIRTQSKIYDPNFRYDTHIEILDMDEECIKDIIHGNGFYIEEPQSIKKDLKSENSIFSSRFGALTGDDTFVDRYRCECGFMRNRINHGRICPNCGTQVKYIDDNFEYFGGKLIGDFTYNKDNLIISVGNEGNGVSKEIYELSNKKVKIPMPGGAESSNVAIATSIILYEKVRQNKLNF